MADALLEAHREHDRHASPHRLAAVERGLVAQPQVLRLAAIALPAGDGGAEQQHVDALAGRQRRNHLGARAGAHNVDLGLGAGGIGSLERRGAVGALDHVAGQARVQSYGPRLEGETTKALFLSSQRSRCVDVATGREVGCSEGAEEG